jgi:Flp pilus assembly protein TadG
MRGAMTNRRLKQAGLATIEMVIVTPLLLLLLLGVSELGKAFMQQNTLNKSVRDAARQVSSFALLGTTGTVFMTAALAADARNLVVFGNIEGRGNPRLPGLAINHVKVFPPVGTAGTGGNNLVMVQADYPYIPITGPFLETFGLGRKPALGITLTASVRMRAL